MVDTSTLGDPKAYVAYISVDETIVKKHDMIKAAISEGEDDLVRKITNTYVRKYKCDLNEMVGRDETGWVRDDEKRLIRRVKQFNSTTRGQDQTIDYVFENGEGYCLIIPKFTKTIEAVTNKGEKLKALFEILHGLVAIDGTFVINDLHNGNMAIMPDGHAVTFDYDKACSPEEFPAYVEKIHATPDIYQGLPQYKHILDLADKEVDMSTLTKISDILAVLASVEETARTSRAIIACRAALWNANDKVARDAAITQLETIVVLSAKGGKITRKRLPRLY